MRWRRWTKKRVWAPTTFTFEVTIAVKEPLACHNFSVTFLLPFLFQRVLDKNMPFRCISQGSTFDYLYYPNKIFSMQFLSVVCVS